MILKIAKFCRSKKIAIYVVCCVVLSVVFAVSSVLQPSLLSGLIGGATDGGADSGIRKQVWHLLAVVAISTFSNSLLTWQEDRLMAIVRFSLQVELVRKTQVEKLHANSGQGIQVIVEDTSVISSYLVGLISKLLPGIGMFLFALVALLRIDPLLTILVIGLGLILVGLSSPFLKRMARAEQGLWSSREMLSERLLSYFETASVAKLNGQLGPLQQMVEVELARLRQSAESAALVKAQFAPFNNSIVPILAVFALGIASWRVRMGEITNGDLIAFLMYMFVLTGPLLRVVSLASQRAKANTAWLHVASLLNGEPPKMDLPDRVRRAVDEKTGTLLDSSGYVVVVGASGSGKTTLLKEVAAKIGERNVAYVGQQPQILPGVIQDTLMLYGDETTSRRFFDNLAVLGLGDLKPNSLVSGLSGGERQRVAIAAALASMKRTIILDEPTSALGAREQQKLLMLLREKVQSKHRVILSTHNSTFIGWLKPDMVLQIGK